MTILLVALGALAAVVLIASAIGTRLPERHTATVSAAIARPPADVHAQLRDAGGWAAWHPRIRKMERLPEHDGREHWLMHDASGRIPIAIVESVAPAAGAPGRLVTSI